MEYLVSFSLAQLFVCILDFISCVLISILFCQQYGSLFGYPVFRILSSRSDFSHLFKTLQAISLHQGNFFFLKFRVSLVIQVVYLFCNIKFSQSHMSKHFTNILYHKVEFIPYRRSCSVYSLMFTLIVTSAYSRKKCTFVLSIFVRLIR